MRWLVVLAFMSSCDTASELCSGKRPQHDGRCVKDGLVGRNIEGVWTVNGMVKTYHEPEWQPETRTITVDTAVDGWCGIEIAESEAKHCYLDDSEGICDNVVGNTDAQRLSITDRVCVDEGGHLMYLRTESGYYNFNSPASLTFIGEMTR